MQKNSPFQLSAGTSGYPIIKLLPAFAILLALLAACYNTSLTEYTPGNKNEAEIVTLLIRYQDAKNDCDLGRFLACLHDRGEYYIVCGVMMKKEKLKAFLPGFWNDLKAGKRTVYPMMRENLNGNYFLKGRFVNPQIVIGDNKTDITITFVSWGHRMRHYISLAKENGQWLINGLDWETG